jgi:hypothetical protein
MNPAITDRAALPVHRISSSVTGGAGSRGSAAMPVAMEVGSAFTATPTLGAAQHDPIHEVVTTVGYLGADPRNRVAPDSACEGRLSVVAKKSPDSPAKRPFAEKADSVAAAAGIGSLLDDRLERVARSVVLRGVGVPVSGTTTRPIRATAPNPKNTR